MKYDGRRCKACVKLVQQGEAVHWSWQDHPSSIHTQKKQGLGHNVLQYENKNSGRSYNRQKIDIHINGDVTEPIGYKWAFD